MLPLCVSHSSTNLLQWRKTGRSNAPQVAVKPVNISLSGGRVWKVRTCCSQGFGKIDWITNKSDKSSKGKLVRVALEKGYALPYKEDSDSPEFQNFLWKKLKAVYMFTRPGHILPFLTIGVSASLFPVETIGDLSFKLFVEILKGIVPTFFMIIAGAGLNNLYDVEIDKMNKPYLPLPSGDMSMETGVAITSAAFFMALGIAIMSSPALLFSLLMFSLTGFAYSVDLPFLRWKKHPFLSTICGISWLQCVQLGFFAHIQKYVLGKPIAVTKSLVFSIVIGAFFSIVFNLFKDIPDVEGDKAFGVQSISMELGKEKVFWFCIKMLLTAYGVLLMVGATFSSLPSRLITIIGHSLFATSLLLRVQSVDLSSNTSIHSFYMFLWKLLCAEYFLLPFVR